jgi:signal transduction histidine kinase/CheY-like chemotaxis protein
MKHPTDRPISATPEAISSRPALQSRLDAPSALADASFSAVFDSSAEALLVVDSAGIIQRANSRASELLRLQEPLVRRPSLGDVLPASPIAQLAAFSSGALSPSRQSFDLSLVTGFPIRVTLRSILPGSHHLLLCLEEGPVVRRAEAKWRQVEAELRSVLDSVQAGVILFDQHGRLRWSSARFAEILGLDARQLAGLHDWVELETLVAGRFRQPESFSVPWKSFVERGAEPGHDELEILRPAPRILERFYRPVFGSERVPVGWLEIYSDVTEHRQIRSKMLQTEKMVAPGQLVSGIAHELNNPLTTIMGYAQLLLGHGLIPAQLSEARKVCQEAERARRIVKNLLYFARENKPERTPVDLNEIVERTLALRSYELKIENIVVESRLARDLPQTMADPYQLQQVVLNLVINAEQALLAERGQGRIEIRTRVALYRHEKRLALEVSDDGPGIPREIAPRIFDPFFTTKAPGVGTGLGLSIVYGIVRQHDGEVTFDSLPGSGARFLVELPVVPVPVAARVPSIPRIAERSCALATGRILVVEDEPTVAQLIVDILQEDGHQAEAVLESQEGLTRISRNRYDLVICDLRMPLLDGRAFYQSLVRAGSPLQNCILFITGDTLAPRTLEFFERHRLPHLAKPFLVEELKVAVSHQLDSRGKPGPSARAAKTRGSAGEAIRMPHE